MARHRAKDQKSASKKSAKKGKKRLETAAFLWENKGNIRAKQINFLTLDTECKIKNEKIYRLFILDLFYFLA
ncbi:hypothetical protein J7J23_00025 [bacterium]|nr:hypothetical protein [bacterium]